MTGRKETLSWFLGAMFALAAVSPLAGQTPAGTIAPERMQAMIVSFNAWLTNIRAPLSGTDRAADVARVTKAHQDMSSAPWAEPFPGERSSIMARLGSILYFVNSVQPGQPYPAQVSVLCSEIFTEVLSVRRKMVEMNGFREVLYAENGGTATASTGTTNPPATVPPPAANGNSPTAVATGSGPLTPDGRTTPGSGPGSLLGVGSTGSPSGTSASTTSGSTGTTSAATGNTTASSATTTGTTGGAVNRGGAKQSLMTAHTALQSLLADENINNGAIAGYEIVGGAAVFKTTQAARDSLSDIAGLINRPPLSTSYAGDVSAIVSQMRALAQANFGNAAVSNLNGAYTVVNNQIRGVRESIYQKINALNAKIDAGQ